MLQSLNAELIDRQPFISTHIHPVDQTNKIAARLTVFLVLHRHTADQQAMEQAIGGKLHWHAQFQHLP
ncbi:hypothetical protein D3C80_1546360 [compost metagenome]